VQPRALLVSCSRPSSPCFQGEAVTLGPRKGDPGSGAGATAVDGKPWRMRGDGPSATAHTSSVSATTSRTADASDAKGP